MNYIWSIVFFIGLVFCQACTGTCSKKVEKQETKPNVVIFFVDDLGWTDVGCFGSDFYQTPNIDKLAQKGMRFTNGYAACTVCSPTRAALMSGKYPSTLHCTDWIEGYKVPDAKLAMPDWTMYLDTTEYTLAQAFKSEGYATGHFGKWHLGEDEKYWPENRGFDTNIGGWTWGAPNLNKSKGYKGYFSPYGNPRIKDGPDEEYLTERLANEACSFISKHTASPFFMNFCFYNVHTPLQAKKEKVEKYKKLVDASKHQSHPVYAAMVEHVDEAVGKVLDKLEKEDLLKNTIIIFSSDNGGLIGRWGAVTNNHPLKLGKGHMYEGGIRVPNIIVMPNGERAGETIETPMITMDFYPTLVDIAGISLPKKVKKGLEGVSLLPLIQKKKEIKRDFLIWHYPHYHTEGASPYSAIRKGDWKLIYFMESESFELYNLKEDIGESNNLFENNMDKAQELAIDLSVHLRKTKAQRPLNKKTGRLISWADEKLNHFIKK